MLETRHGARFWRRVFCWLLVVCWVRCAGQTVRGIVHNGTNGKPQPGDLIVVMAGNNEMGRVVSDKNGDFRIELNLPAGTSPDTLKARLVHDGVSYQQAVKLGFATDVTVYDGSARVAGLSEHLGIFQFEARTADHLVVTELHAIQNESWPPRTSTKRESFDLSLPKGAHNLSVTITEPDGQGAKLSIADPADEHAPLQLGVPLKPGLTKYVLTYELPYDGELHFRQSARYFTKQNFVVLPMSMHFTPGAALQFHAVPDDTGAQIRETDSLAARDVLDFTISGTGALARAFHQIGGSDESALQNLPAQPANVGAPRTDASLTSPTSASNGANAKTPPPAAPTKQSVRNWAALVVVLLTVGALIAWKVSRAKVRHGSA
ncbi:MAG TPA: carboxypeptidase-like regulatory domain-containing protein [Terriglobales bacterium]|jgi:hypothetical protein|nr:carboxypeptidase-like regulatory domain-containing protein [Terriglobales bacterium]